MYDGDATSSLLWSKSFRHFLQRHEERWPILLDEVENFKGQQIVETMERPWEAMLQLGPSPVKERKSVLSELLETYTKGRAREVVDSYDEQQALNA